MDVPCLYVYHSILYSGRFQYVDLVRNEKSTCKKSSVVRLVLLVQLTVAFLLKISSISILILARGHLGGQKKRETSRDLNLLSNCAVFQPKLNNLQKTFKNEQKPWKNTVLSRFFNVFSIVAEKQRKLTTNSSPMSYFASFDIQNIPKRGLI